MKVPVAAFADERLTDAPYDLLAVRLREPKGFKHLTFAASRMVVQESPDELRLVWTRRRLASEEQGVLILRRDERGAYLRIEGQVKGWGCFLVFGMLRWQADDLLDRLVEEL